MTRIAAATVAVAIAMLGILSTADAQSTYPPSDPIPVRGSTFEPNPATANSGVFGFESINPQPSAATGDDATGGTGGGLAFTGGETDLSLAIGITLLAAGGTAVVASRKREQE